MFVDANALTNLQQNLGRDSLAFLPELILCGAIVLLLLLRLFKVLDRVHLGWVALVLTLAAVVVSWGQWLGLALPASELERLNLSGLAVFAQPHGMFTGLLAYDTFTVFLRLFLFGFAALLVWLSLLTGIPDREDSADFYCLVLGASIGMAIMASANHLLMVYIGVEMASLPSYALAGFLKGRRQSSEASLKYVVYGGGASGVMLYGISLVAGKFGTAYLPDLAAALTTTLHPVAAGVEAARGVDALVLLGTLFILIGIGFKLAAVPFHFWCPDVFEGASAEVAGFLSVASKGAALALLGRFVLVLAGPGLAQVPLDWQHINPINPTWLTVTQYLAPILAVAAALTATFGNLAAYLQTNLKRLLAYSTIAHAGYMMMGLAVLTRDGAAAVLLYLVAYLFMNLGAFAVVAFLRNETGSEDLSSFRGLVRRSPWMVVTLGVFLLSLLGLPPLAGFAAKFQIFRVLVDAAVGYRQIGQTGLSDTMWALLVIGGINTVFSAVYYLKVMKVMVLERSLEDVEERPSEPLPEPLGAKVYAALLVAAIFLVGIFWDPLATASRAGVQHFQQPAAPVAQKGEVP